MLKYYRFTNTNNGKLLWSVLLGLGLASLLRKVCKGGNCTTHITPKKGFNPEWTSTQIPCNKKFYHLSYSA